MKAIQITIDERLLEALDKRSEVRRLGRSAIIRAAVYAWLHEKREREIGEMYRRAYAKPDRDLEAWARLEGAWPED